MSAELLNVIKNNKNRPVSVPEPPQINFPRVARKPNNNEDFFTSFGNKFWRETKSITDAILGNTVALSLVAIATLLTVDASVEGFPGSILYKILASMEQVKVLKKLVDMIKKDPQRFLGSFYFLSVFWIVRGTERFVIVVAAVISLTMFDDIVSNALAALLVLAVFRVKDKELRMVAVVIAGIYIYLYVNGKPVAPPTGGTARSPVRS